MALWDVQDFKPTVVGAGIGRRVLSTNRIRSWQAMKNQLLSVKPSMRLLNYELKHASLSRMTAF